MSAALLITPLVFQAIVMLVDEGWFHRRRGLPRWERVGHPLDTLTVLACYSWVLLVPAHRPHATTVYAIAAAFSCVFVTKDEPVHRKFCSAGETWLHSLLFLLHPLAFIAVAILWIEGGHTLLLQAQWALTLAFGLYQLVYWSLLWRPRTTDR